MHTATRSSPPLRTRATSPRSSPSSGRVPRLASSHTLRRAASRGTHAPAPRLAPVRRSAPPRRTRHTDTLTCTHTRTHTRTHIHTHSPLARLRASIDRRLGVATGSEYISGVVTREEPSAARNAGKRIASVPMTRGTIRVPTTRDRTLSILLVLVLVLLVVLLLLPSSFSPSSSSSSRRSSASAMARGRATPRAGGACHSLDPPPLSRGYAGRWLTRRGRLTHPPYLSTGAHQHNAALLIAATLSTGACHSTRTASSGPARTRRSCGARALPRVATAFSRVWAVAPEELVSSFEAFSLFAPPGEPERIAGWRPVEVGLVVNRRARVCACVCGVRAMRRGCVYILLPRESRRRHRHHCPPPRLRQ